MSQKQALPSQTTLLYTMSRSVRTRTQASPWLDQLVVHGLPLHVHKGYAR